MSKRICQVCHSVMDEDECFFFWQEWHDEVRATEHFAGMQCPECGADGEFLLEAVECKECGNFFEPDQLYGGELCEECLKWYVRNVPFLIWEYLEDQKDELAEFLAEKI